MEHVQLPVTQTINGSPPSHAPKPKRADARTPAGVPQEIRSSALGEVLLFQGQCGPYSAPRRAQPISAGRRLLNLAGLFFSLKTTKARPKKKKKRRPKARSEADGEEAELQHTVQERGRCASARRANTRHLRRFHPTRPSVPLEILTANRCRRVECTVNSRARSSSTDNATARRLYDRPQILVMPFLRDRIAMNSNFANEARQ